jgi:phosphomannomutase
MLGRIAQTLGVHYEETLTGFKWIANRAMALERTQGMRFVFGYEEALGYTVGDVVRDKDGVSAAVMMAELAAILADKGKTLLDALEDLYRTYGLYGSAQVSVTRTGAEGVRAIRALMDGLRQSAPREVGDYDVIAFGDYTTGTRTELASGKTTPLTLPKTNMLAFELVARQTDGVETGGDVAERIPGSRIIARPSGTEPKVKFYFDLREKVRPSEPIAEAEERLRTKLADLAKAWEALLPAAS